MYRRKGKNGAGQASRAVWYIDKRLPVFGRFGPISTRTSRKQAAQSIEGMIVALNDKGRRDILELIAKGEIDLMATYTAHVEGKLDELVSSHQDSDGDPLLSEAIERFMLVAQDPRYRSTYNWLLKKAPSNARLSWLADSDTIQELLNGRLQAGMKPATAARDKAAISALLGHQLGEARRREILHKRVRVKQPDNGRIRWLTQEEIDRLRDVSDDWWVFWCYLLSFGVRRGEGITARVEDVDFDAGQVRVWGTKSESAKRTVPMEGEIVGLLRGWITAKNLDRHDLLFPKLGRNRGLYVWRAWRDCCEKAEVHGATIHDLRHTFSVHAVKCGMPLPELQRRLGHSKMKETWRYASFVPPATSEHHSAALDRMGLSGHPTDIPTLQRKAL